jgi:hypothetical protein
MKHTLTILLVMLVVLPMATAKSLRSSVVLIHEVTRMDTKVYCP